MRTMSRLELSVFLILTVALLVADWYLFQHAVEVMMQIGRLQTALLVLALVYLHARLVDRILDLVASSNRNGRRKVHP